MKRLTWTLFLFTACTSTSPSGFLENFDQLESKPDYRSDLVYIKPGADLRIYDRLIIDPVEVRLNPDSNASSLGADTLQKAATAFRNILIESIDPYYTVVNEIGPNVMRVRLALTDVIPSGKGISVGEAAMEVELLDPESGERLAAALDRIKGSEQGTRAPAEWSNIEGAFREWAQRMLDFMDSYHE